MSRIVVKNLPKVITEEHLRKLFREKGNVTDVQLKYNSKGVFRQFAFVGYETEEEAQKAIEHFDNTRIKTSKITVELCASLGEAKKKKKAVLEDNNNEGQKVAKNDENVVPKKITDEVVEKYKNDPLFREFLEARAPTEAEKLAKLVKTAASESDGEDEGRGSSEEKDAAEDEEELKLANKDISDLEYMKGLMQKKERKKMEKKPKEKVELFTLKLSNLPYKCKKKDLKDFLRPNIPFSIRIPRNIKGIAYIGFKQEKQFKKALLKNKSILGSKQVSVVEYVKHGGEEQSTETNPNRNRWKSQEESLKNEEDIGESGKIFFRNLTYTCTEDDMQKLFEKYGPVTEVNLPIDTTTKKIKGFGTVTFLMPEHAVKAYVDLDGSAFQGRMLHLLPGKSKDQPQEDLEESSNFKLKKAKQQKAQAGSSHNWNSLFLSHDAVAEVIADSYGTTKEAVLAPHGDSNAGVRLALGETEIVANTRKYLEEHGIYLDAFKDSKSKRSKTVILVKNLPAKTEIKEISSLFQVHGELARVLLPPGAITAIVEFVEPSEARKAFMKLAYSKFKSTPLYLEWAPENVTQKSGNEHVKEKVNTSETKDDVKVETSEEVEMNEDAEPEEDTTLFVKNLNFQTTDKSLLEHFKPCGRVFYANVATKKDKNDPGNKLSMGYGFVRFYLKSSADKALKTLQQSILDGKSLELKRSERTLKNEVTAVRKTNNLTKQTGTKLLVRNVPFQANKDEILQLFQTFGEIKALRLPKKMTPGSNSHRGFAFVDYTTNSDAKKAFEGLSQSTHLYGRRLVIEWAQKEEGVEEIRKRTADHFHQNKEAKLSRKSVFNID